MPHRYEDIDFNHSFSTISKEVVEQMQTQEVKQNQKDFDALMNALQEGKCYLCGRDIDECDEKNPCFHFLLNPRLKRKYINALISQPISFIQLYTYLAWVANTERPCFNINDTLSDIANKRLFETTIRYKNIEWSFNFKQSDFEGHQDTKIGNSPHYHFHMTVDGKPIATFNKCHISFTPYDFLMFEIIKQGAAAVDTQFASGLETLIQSVIVNIHPDGLIQFIEVISEKEIYVTFIKPGTITKSQIEEIGVLFNSSELLIYQIIDKINKEKGYSIIYEVYSQEIDNPVIKVRRD